jgi:hypothetical protein
MIAANPKSGNDVSKDLPGWRAGHMAAFPRDNWEPSEEVVPESTLVTVQSCIDAYQQACTWGMSRTKISQAEARRLRARVIELENRETIRRRRWGSEYPGGINVACLDLDLTTGAELRTCQLLDRPIVVRVNDANRCYFYAVQP